MNHLTVRVELILKSIFFKFRFNFQKELSAELALRTKAERNKQDEVRNTNIVTPVSGGSSRRRDQQRSNNNRNISSATHSSSSSRSRQRSKKEKLFCICQTPYDDTKYDIELLCFQNILTIVILSYFLSF